MGSVKSVAIKSLGDDVISRNKGKFSEDFEENKLLLKDILPIKSKRTRNVLAGYICNRMKLAKKRGF